MNAAHSQRLAALDAARGIAMLLVCTAHFLFVCSEKLPQYNVVIIMLGALTKIATPSFVLISGILLGYFQGREESFQRMRIHLLDRALFLLTIGHVLLLASFIAIWGWSKAFTHWDITDTLGASLIAGLVVLRYCPAISTRLLLAVLLYLIGWTGWNSWHPDNTVLSVLRNFLLGPDESKMVGVVFPFLPWFGIYLMGTVVGSWLSSFRRISLSQAGKDLAKYSSITLGVAISIKGLLVWFDISRSLYLPLLSYSKYPPGPLYVLTYASAALLLLGILLVYLESSKAGNPLIAIAQRLGRNSFSVFLCQSFLYFTVIHLIVSRSHEVSMVFAVLLWTGSILCIVWLSGVFERFSLSRAWTVGLPILTGKYPSRFYPVSADR